MTIGTVAAAKAGALQPMWHQKPGVSVITSAVGHYHTYGYSAGQPVAQAVPAPGVAGVALTAPYAGAFPHTNPASGETKILAAQFNGSTSAGQVLLIDRLWHNSGLSATLTSAQTVNSAAWPARDVNGATSGAGVYVMVEISTALGAASPTMSMSYTNSAGTSGRTASNIITLVNGMQAGYVVMMGLQAGDVGVQSIQSFTLSVSAVSGVYSLVAFRPLAQFPMLGTVTPFQRSNTTEDIVSLAGCKILDSSVLQLLAVNLNTGSTYNVGGSLALTQG